MFSGKRNDRNSYKLASPFKKRFLRVTYFGPPSPRVLQHAAKSERFPSDGFLPRVQVETAKSRTEIVQAPRCKVELSHGRADPRHAPMAHFPLRRLDVGPPQVPLRNDENASCFCVRAGMFKLSCKPFACQIKCAHLSHSQ